MVCGTERSYNYISDCSAKELFLRPAQQNSYLHCESHSSFGESPTPPTTKMESPREMDKRKEDGETKGSGDSKEYQEDITRDAPKKRKLKQKESREDLGNATKKAKNVGVPPNLVNVGGETTEARRESHKIIEQKRRQKINDKINELRELLNYPDGSHNKAVVLQAAVDNIKNLKLVCSKLLASHRQLQEDYLNILVENEKLRKLNTFDSSQPNPQQYSGILEKEGSDDAPSGIQHSLLQHAAALKKKGIISDSRLPDLNMSFLYDEVPSSLPYPANNGPSPHFHFPNGTTTPTTTRDFQPNGAIPYGQEALLHAVNTDNLRQPNRHFSHKEQDHTIRT